MFMKNYLIYYSLFIFSFFQLSANILENNYNSVSGNTSLITGDVEGYGLGFSTTGHFADEGSDGVALMFSVDHIDITAVSGVDLSGVDIEQNSLTYGIGYIFKGEKTHFIPYFLIIDAELGANGYRAAEYDGNAFGLILRTILSEKSAISYSIANSDIDNMTVLGTSVNVADVSPETTFGFDIQNEIAEGSSFNLGAAFADGITTLSVGLNIKF